MGLRNEVLKILVAALILGAVNLLFPGVTDLLILSATIAGVVLLDGLVKLFRGAPIPGFLLLNLALIIMGLGLLVYGIWSTVSLETTPGGFGSYSWIIAQVNVIAGMLIAGMGVVFFTLPRRL